MTDDALADERPTDGTDGRSAAGAPLRDLVSQLTLEEKAALSSGSDFWHTTAVPRLDIPVATMSDGPYGLRKDRAGGADIGIGGSIPATCFPPAVALGSSFDPELIERVGAAIADEARDLGVDVVLGPGINIKRSPLGGRNFEYFSEDPLVSGICGAAMVRGTQSRGVGTSLKHFAANNQEHDRMRVSSEVDPRTLREIYLRGFQRVVTTAQPWTVMCSYNRLNGVYTSQDPWLLSTVLRDEWGFEGLVVSDWGAVEDRVESVRAGLDLEMPSSRGHGPAALVSAVRSGRLDDTALHRSVARVLDLVDRSLKLPAGEEVSRVDEHHALAREAASRCIVLLRNEGDLLPLVADTKIAVIGEFARSPRYQGGGSAHVNPTRLDTGLDAIVAVAGADRVRFAPGFRGAEPDRVLVDEAVAAARAADVAVVFLGLPDEAESEGFDRATIDLPASQVGLAEAVLAVNRNTVVVLSHGAVVDLTGLAGVPAVLEAWLLGQAGGAAIADVLFGQVNPSGRLAETIPLRLADSPAYLNFPGENGEVRYGEGVFVGYRWYDARDMEVAFPFGHGLSYTTFSYGDLTVEPSDDGYLARVPVTNTGDRAGREIVQLYSAVAPSTVGRPPRELRGFAVLPLQPGESATAEIAVAREDLAYWDVRVGRWVVEGGDYEFFAGASSRDLRAGGRVPVPGDDLDLPLTLASTLREVAGHPVAGPAVRELLTSGFGPDAAADFEAGVGWMSMLASVPIGRATLWPGMTMTRDDLEQFLANANLNADAAREG